jgi:hypothetical protein
MKSIYLPTLKRAVMKNTFTYFLIPIFLFSVSELTGQETFVGPGIDFFDNTNWFDGSSPLGCGGNSGIEIIIGADCETASCGLQTDFHHKLTINSGVTFTSNMTAGQHIMKGPNGELTNKGTMEIDQTFQVAAGSTHYNEGTINVNASTFWVNSGEGPVTMQNTGTININSGGSFRDVVTAGCTLDNDNMIIINSGGLVDFDGTNAVLDNSGIITVNGTLNINSGCVNTGTINGSGTLISSSANLAGTVQPGNSVGILNTTNAITFSGTIEIEADDRTTYDVINSTNTGTLGINSATIHFILAGSVNDYADGDKFQVFTGFAANSDNPTITNSLSGNGLVVAYNGNGEFEITTGGLLPVELIDFTAKTTDNQIQLNWQTASEENNHGFEVQRSTDGRDWEVLDFVAGNGTTLEVQNYTYTDEKPLAGTNYYRLKQMDFDGQFEYSEIVEVRIDQLESQNVKIYPNPVQDRLMISNTNGIKNIVVYNTLGQQIRQLTVDNNEQLSIDTNDLPKGIYTVQLQKTNGNMITKQFVK